MTSKPIDPLGNVPTSPLIASIPKADLHLHQEAEARLERVAAQRRGQPAHDWRDSARKMMSRVPPGMQRLTAIYEPDTNLDLDSVSDNNQETFITRVANTLQESAADGAVITEVRFGSTGQALTRPDFMALFREAERRVQKCYPQFRAEAIAFLYPIDDPDWLASEEKRLEACLRIAREGLAGVDFRVDPYDTEANPSLWTTTYRWAERAREAGLGITVHAGEFSTANLAAALRVPGLGRLGHAVYAAKDDRLLEKLALSGATVECSLTCNVILGAVESYETHPIKEFVAHGIPVTLNTDLPVHTATTIGREYAIGAVIGFSPGDLLGFTRNAIKASFTTPERRRALLDELRTWECELPSSPV